MPNREIYQELLDCLTHFAESQPEPELARFRSNLLNWGTEFSNVGSNILPASRHIDSDLITTTARTHTIIELFSRFRTQILWEQSYTSDDNAVGEEMLTGYCFAEIIGKNGPFVSNKIRCGIGIWGPNIVYPVHQHRAEEIYIVLAGSASFALGETKESRKIAEDAVYVRSMQKHGFTTASDRLVVFYAWQNGDLREKSNFN